MMADQPEPAKHPRMWISLCALVFVLAISLDISISYSECTPKFNPTASSASNYSVVNISRVVTIFIIQVYCCSSASYWALTQEQFSCCGFYGRLHDARLYHTEWHGMQRCLVTSLPGCQPQLNCGLFLWCMSLSINARVIICDHWHSPSA